MATAYPTIARTDYAADDSVTVTAAAALPAIQECVIRKPSMIYFAQVIETSTSYVDQYDWYHYITPQMAGRYLMITIEALVTGGTGYWSVIDKDDGDALVSDEVAVTGGWADSTATITIPAGWTEETRRHLAIQSKTAATFSIYLRSTDKITCWCTD